VPVHKFIVENESSNGLATSRNYACLSYPSWKCFLRRLLKRAPRRNDLYQEFACVRSVRPHYVIYCTLPVMGEASRSLKLVEFISWASDRSCTSLSKYGYLLLSTLEDVPDSHDIFKRFAKQYSKQTLHCAFLDLQKSWKRKLERQKFEAALEKSEPGPWVLQHSDEIPEASKKKKLN